MIHAHNAHALVAIKRQIDRERNEAEPVVRRMCSTSGSVAPDEPIPPERRTIGLVHELTAAATGLQESNPRLAISLAHLAVGVVSSIEPDRYPYVVIAEAEAAAWVQLANVHRYLSEYDLALRAIDAADRILMPVFALGFDRAMAQFARALVYCDKHEFDAADALLNETELAFREYGDRGRQGKCLLLRGMLQHRRGNVLEARTLYEAAIPPLSDADDLQSLGSVYNNLAHAYGDLGNSVAAALAVRHALAIFEELGLTGEIARAKCVLGRILMGDGRFTQARDVLFEGRRMLLALGMPEEAGLAGLELAEVFIALGESFRAQAIVEEIVTEFRQAGLNHRAATAVGYLRQFVSTPRAADAVRHVKAYVATLRREPDRAFLPLPDAT